MSNYRVRNLNMETPRREQERLQAALLKVPGVHKVTLLPLKREFRFTFTGKEPSFNVLREACDSVGFMLERKSKA
jgi:hypothetical protein